MPKFTHPHGYVGDRDSFANFTTTIDTDVDVGTWNVQFLKTKRMRFVATTNALTVTILGSIDGGVTYPITVVAAFSVPTATPNVQTITDYLTNLKVQVRPTVAAAHGTLATTFAGISH